MTLETFIKGIRALNANKLILKAASLTREELADLNVSNLEQGELANGKRTDKYASTVYSTYKRAIGSKSTPYMDLKLEGDFTEGINVKVSSKIEFGSTDEKAEMLQQRYSKDIFGVQEPQLADTIDADVSQLIINEITK